MGTLDRGNTNVGELVMAAFDDAALHSTDPGEVSRMAVHTIVGVLSRHWRSAVRSAPLRPSKHAPAVDRGPDESSSVAIRNGGEARIVAAWTRFLRRAELPTRSLAEAVRLGVLTGRADW